MAFLEIGCNGAETRKGTGILCHRVAAALAE
jgi:hypothetical protein